MINISEGSFFLPTFTDLHLHAPQYLYAGTGLDLPLFDWLAKYTFPAEEGLDNDAELARKVYKRLGERLLEEGTGSVLLHGTIKAETKYVKLPSSQFPIEILIDERDSA